MKKNYYSLLFLILSCCFLSSCDYPLTEDYYRDIELEDLKFNFSLKNFNNDEVFRENKEIYFDFKTDNEKAELVAIIFYRNDSRLFTSNSSSGNFTINIDNLYEGKHALKVEIILRTGTGSLADKFGQESYLGELEYTFNVDKSINKINISKVEHRDGSIYINWVKPEHLERYSDIKLIIRESYRRTIIPLLDKDSLIKKEVFRDSLSLKFNTKYQIEATNKYNKLASEEINFYVVDSIVKFEHSYIDENNYKISWNKHPLYNNFNNYIFDEGSTNLRLSAKGGEMQINSPFYFGNHKTYSFEKERQTYMPFNEIHYGTITYGTPYNNQNYTNLIFDKNNRYLYATNINRDQYPFKIGVFKLDSNDLSIIKKVEIISNNSDTPDLIFNNNSDLILDFRTKSYLIDQNNLTTLEIYDANIYDQTKLPVKCYFRNGLMFIRYNDDFKNIFAFNATSKELVATLQKDFANVFDSYEYFTVDRDLYKIENQDISLIHSLSEDEPRIYRLKHIEESNKLILQVGGYSVDSRDCIIYNLQNNTKSKIFGSESTTFLNYDSKTNTAVFTKLHDSYNSTDFNLYFINMGNQSIKPFKVGRSYRGRYRLYNNNLIVLDFDYYLKNPLKI